MDSNVNSLAQSAKNEVKVSFYLKKKVSRNGFCPVMGRITVDKEIVQFSCKIDADPSLWDTRAGRANGKSHHARTVNRKIDKINVAVNAKYKEIMSIKGMATADEVKSAYQGILSSQETVLSIFRQHNEDYKKRIGVNISESTWINYDSSYKHLERFIQKKYHVSDLTFRQLDYTFIENFHYYLRIECKLKPNTIQFRLLNLRKMVKTAIGKRIISRDPFFGFSAKREKGSPKFVPIDELNRLINTSLKCPKLVFTRDMFLFSCFTGLAFIDLYNLTNQQIVKAEDGTFWLHTFRQKTGGDVRIPLLEKPLQIIETHKGTTLDDEHRRVFLMKNSQYYYRQLKKLAKQCGIDRNLTFHMARHTFATETCLSQGVPIETVSRMLGHKELVTTQIYARVTHDKIEEDMKALAEKLKGKYILLS